MKWDFWTAIHMVFGFLAGLFFVLLAAVTWMWGDYIVTGHVGRLSTLLIARAGTVVVIITIAWFAIMRGDEDLP